MSKNHIHLSLSSDEQYFKVAKAGGDKPFWPFTDKHYTLHYTYLQHKWLRVLYICLYTN